MNNEKNLHVKLDTDTHHAFGLKCFESGLRMSKTVRILIKKYLAGEVTL